MLSKLKKTMHDSNENINKERENMFYFKILS